MAVELPCAVKGVCAHGTGIVVATGVAVPHDSALSVDAGHARMCNTHHLGMCGRRRGRLAAVRPDLYGLHPREPPRTGVRPISSRKPTDLDAECDRSRRGLRPISRRNRTDLDAEYDRSRGGTGPISVRVGERVATASREGFPGEPAPGMRTHRCNDAHSAHWSPSPTLSKSNRIPYAYHR